MKCYLTAPLFLLTASPALAHPGAHDNMVTATSTLEHVLQSPFHIALLLGGLAVVVVAGAILKTKRHFTD